MKKFLKSALSILFLGGFLLMLSGCSIFKEDGCECPSFGQHSHDPIKTHEQGSEKVS